MGLQYSDVWVPSWDRSSLKLKGMVDWLGRSWKHLFGLLTYRPTMVYCVYARATWTDALFYEDWLNDRVIYDQNISIGSTITESQSTGLLETKARLKRAYWGS
jgi:hypothetical protein